MLASMGAGDILAGLDSASVWWVRVAQGGTHVCAPVP